MGRPASDHIVDTATLTLAAGESRTLPLSALGSRHVGLTLPPRFSVRATDATGAAVTAALDLPAVCGVPPVNPTGGWTTAGLLRGGLNVAWRGLGSQPLNEQGNDRILTSLTRLSARPLAGLASLNTA